MRSNKESSQNEEWQHEYLHATLHKSSLPVLLKVSRTENGKGRWRVRSNYTDRMRHDYPRSCTREQLNDFLSCDLAKWETVPRHEAHRILCQLLLRHTSLPESMMRGNGADPHTAARLLEAM